jgi:antitoxin (DNA-binding transcriptional repressor) of toxin-antitoxin stability system
MSVTISELKSRLSHYLWRVRRGETIVVRDRETVIARIEPAGGSLENPDEDQWLDELERRGTIRRATKTLPPDWGARRPVTDVDIVGALLMDRDQDR